MRRISARRRRLLTAAGVILAVAVIFAAVNSPAFVAASAASRRIPIYSVERDGKYCSLSFDAAWGNEDTQKLIDILAAYNVKATFFVVGSWAEKYPESVKALFDAGHEVMNHSDDHAHFNRLSPEEIESNINACSDKIEAITGVRPSLFRCPYGEYDDHVVAAVNAMGMEVIQWDVDSLDWKDYDADTIYSRVTSKVSPGSIVLFHNAALHTPEALGPITEYLLQNGYGIVPVSELILKGDAATDHAGRQRPASRAGAA
ncbi:MAG: polysaccharide deacetylase family protein [Oscillospiraceae bacterium]|nr:polysaccharide deacetylase family protein [Oscillospiraceae bacterium]